MFRQTSLLFYSCLCVGLFGVMGCGDDDGTETGCCVALAGTDQVLCDPLEALGADRCNMANGGSSCQWSAAAACGGPASDGGQPADGESRDAGAEDGGVTGDAALPDGALPREDGGTVDDGGVPDGGPPGEDAGPREDAGMISDGCCQALPGEDQAICDPLEALGENRCNMINGGASCSWSDIPECSTAPTSCCVANAGGDQTACDAIADLGEERCNAVTTCSWSTSDECAAPPTTCCRSIFGGGGPTDRCRTLDEVMCNTSRSCNWSDLPECASEPVVCCSGASPTCADTTNQRRCELSGCAWSPAPMCNERGCCVGDLRTCSRQTSTETCEARPACSWTTDLSMCIGIGL